MVTGRCACGQVSSPYTAETIDSAQALLMVGPLFNDYNTVGFAALISPSMCLFFLRAHSGPPRQLRVLGSGSVSIWMDSEWGSAAAWRASLPSGTALT